jgi:hypothetical protein
MLRRGVKPYLFVINNEGYEIERQIHGWTAEYNEIQQYNHQLEKYRVSWALTCHHTVPIRKHCCAYALGARGIVTEQGFRKGRQNPPRRGIHAPR